MSVAEMLKTSDGAQAARVQKYVDDEKARREARARIAEEFKPHIPQLVAISGTEVYTHPVTPREPVLKRGETTVLKAQQLWQVVASRGVGKSWVLASLATALSTGTASLGFTAPQPRRVLLIDGEMALEDVLSRFRLISSAHGAQLSPDYFKLVAQDDQRNEYLPRLDTPEGQEAVEAFVEWAEVVILDNRSCLLDPEGEKDAAIWQPFQDWLLKLRKRGKTVIWAHHTNRLGGARGLSKAEDIIDLQVKLTWPEDYKREEGARFVAEWEKTRGVYGSGLGKFVAQLKDGAWTVTNEEAVAEASEDAKALEAVRLEAELGDGIKSGNQLQKVLGGRRGTAHKALERLLKAKLVKKDEDGTFRVAEFGSRATQLGLGG